MAVKKSNCENSFLVLFFIVSVMVEIFANFSGTSLIYLLWSTGFLLTHGIYLVGVKVVFVLIIIVILTPV